MAVARMLEQNREGLRDLTKLFRSRNPSHIVTCARGSSDNAASYFKYLSEILLGLPCCSIGASVVSIYGAKMSFRDTILISVSQSGKSPDIVAFQAEAKRVGVPTIVITNDVNSPLAKDADFCLPLYAGPELSVAATKTFITSATLLAAVVNAFDSNTQLSTALDRLPADLTEALKINWEDIVDVVAQSKSIYVLGRGPSMPMAQEAALKLKETSGIHAEAFSAAEVMHGPMELVQSGFPIVSFVPSDSAARTTLASLAQLEKAGARILSTVFQPTLSTALDPISIIQTFYVCAERVARQLERNPDAPRLLKKVTETH